MSELILLLQAEIDIQTAFNRQEDIQEGRGEILHRALDAAFDALRLHPEIGRIYSKPYRRLLVRNFPFGIFYQVQAKRIIVAAVLDLRQDPEHIRKRLS
jgi:plasmid stabilization system protein ParE